MTRKSHQGLSTFLFHTITEKHAFISIFFDRSKEEIVAIAESKIGEEGYSLSRYNCQHFSSYCRNGTHHSPEVNLFKPLFLNLLQKMTPWRFLF